MYRWSVSRTTGLHVNSSYEPNDELQSIKLFCWLLIPETPAGCKAQLCAGALFTLCDVFSAQKEIRTGSTGGLLSPAVNKAGCCHKFFVCFSTKSSAPKFIHTPRILKGCNHVANVLTAVNKEVVRGACREADWVGGWVTKKLTFARDFPGVMCSHLCTLLVI